MTENQEIKKPGKRRIWSRILIGFLILLLLVPITVTLSFQIPQIQLWTQDQITSFLKKKYNVDIQIGRIRLDVFQNLVIENALLVSPQGDTLIRGGELAINMDRGILSLLSDQKDINSLHLKNAYIYIETYENGTNYDQLFSQPVEETNYSVSTPDTLVQEVVKQNALILEFIDLDSVTLYIRNFKNNSIQQFFFDQGRFNSSRINLGMNQFRFGAVELQNPSIAITRLKDGASPPSIESDTTYLPDTAFANVVSAYNPFDLICGQISISGGRFKSENENFDRLTGTGIDYKYLDIQNIDVEADSFYNFDWDYGGSLKHFSGITADGFEITDLYCDQVTVTPQLVELASFTFQTPESILNDTLRFHYNEYLDFQQFEDYVRLDASFKNSKVTVDDLLYFVPKLQDVQFFRDNREEFLILSGIFSGPINRFRGRDMELYLGDKVIMEGRFSSRDLAVRNGALLNLDINSLYTTIPTIREIFPHINFPQGFDKLGEINFDGRFDGYFEDFVAYGTLVTELGNSEMDMRLNSKNGRDEAEYSGSIRVLEFDLGRWVENPDLGKTSFFAEIPNGKGLSLDALNTVVDGNIEHLEFKGYDYKNALVNGRLQKDIFDGQLMIADENIDLSFNGEVDFADSIPHLDFLAKIEKFDLQAVNLTEKDLVLSGQFTLNIDEIDINKFIGEVNASHLLLDSRSGERFYIDSLLGYSHYIPGGKKLVVRSDLFDLNLEGNYLLTDLLKHFQSYVYNQFPNINHRLNFPKTSVDSTFMNYTFESDIHNSGNWLKLFDVPIENIRNATISGRFNDIDSIINFNATVPTIEYNQSVFKNLITQWGCKGGDCTIQLNLDQSQLSEQSILNSIESEFVLHGDEVAFQIRSEDVFNVVNLINLAGNASIGENNYVLNLNPSDIIIFNKPWNINRNNEIKFNKNNIDLKNVELTYLDERIFIDNLGPRGLHVEVENIPMGLIDTIWDYNELNFSGAFRGEANVENLKNLDNLTFNGFVDSLVINGDYFGELFVSLGQKQKGNPLAGFLRIENEESRLVNQGYIYPAKEPGGKTTLDFDLSIDDYPVAMLEYWLKNGISNTQGVVDANIEITGSTDDPQMNGEGRVFNGQTTIDYLQTTYYFHDQPIDISTTLIDLSNAEFSDKFGNRAQIDGGIYHQFIANGGVDARITSPQALVLNTTIKDNKLYYGNGIGKIDATFKGPFHSVDMYINAETARGTELNIPITSNYISYSGDFVTFVKFDSTNGVQTSIDPINLQGLDLKMDLTITDAAQVNIIFDERAGDIIEGNGRGTLQLEVNRSGDMEIHGEYEIERGEYLFTLYDIVNKPFEIKRGGTIRWSGDPYDAEIDIDAEYKGLSASLQTFLEEYSETISSDTRLTTQVQLLMNLTGDLFEPDIAFDINFPSLTGELKNYADSKLNILRADPNELNQQVFGLIVLGSFIPSNSNPLGNQFVSSSSVNTLSQLFSNQLSIYITELISEAVAGNEFISGVDFDLGWNLNPELSRTAEESIISGSEVQFRLNNRLFDDRLTFNVGANIVNNSTIANNYIAGVWGLEYSLTPDNRLKVRLYQQPEESLNGLLNKFGLGISFRKEFDAFFQESTSEAVKELQSTEPVGILNN